MIGTLKILDVLLPVLYAALFAGYLTHFVRGPDRLRPPRLALFGVLGLHALSYVLRGVEFGYVPLSNPAEFLSLLALAIGVAFALLDATPEEGKASTGVFFIGISFVFKTIGSLTMSYGGVHPVLLENPIYGLHALSMLLGFTSLAVGALYALMYAILERQLKSLDIGVFFKRLPPLGKLDRMARLGTAGGVVLLGLGLALGYVVAWTVKPDSFNFLDVKVLVADAVWLGYVAGWLWSRFRGLSGAASAYLTMVWFFVLLTSVGVAHQAL